MDDHHEEFERIPWSELTASTSPGRSRMLYMGAAVVAAVVVGVVAGRMMSAPAPDPVAPGTTIAAQDTALPEEAPSTPVPSTSLPEIPGLYREADLMALPPAGPERAAMTRAEWFVYDFFTADLEPAGSADVLGALPTGSELPEMPQDNPSSLSYVEWARAFRVEETGDGLYRVGVVFRVLGAPPEHGFTRLGARAVEVTVAVSEDGGTVVTDLPSPIGMPTAPEPDPWPEAASEEVPSTVLEGAAAAAGAWGNEPRFVSGQPIDGGWRIVLTLADEVGNRWPVAVRVDADGRRLG